MAQGEDSGLWAFGFILVLIGLLSWFLWHNFKEPMVQGLLYWRQAQIRVASLWTDDEKPIKIVERRVAEETDPMHDRKLGEDKTVETVKYITFKEVRDIADKVTPKQIIAAEGFIPALTQAALAPYKYVFAVLFVLMALWSVYNGPTSKLRRKLGLESLIAEHAKMFKFVTPFVKFNPLKLAARAVGAPVPKKLAPFSEALSPEEFAVFHNISVLENKPKKERFVDVKAAEEAFKQQLLGPWKGWQALPAPLQVLLASFAMRAARKRDESEAILQRLMLCWSFEDGMKIGKDSGLVGEARKFLKSKDAEATLNLCQRHAYLATAMVRALQYAREEGGVCAPAQFLWLRGYNRALWYPLNNVGRQAFHMEALGAMSHFRAEKMVGRPIIKPMLSDAVRGLNEHLCNPIFSKPLPARAA